MATRREKVNEMRWLTKLRSKSVNMVAPRARLGELERAAAETGGSLAYRRQSSFTLANGHASRKYCPRRSLTKLDALKNLWLAGTWRPRISSSLWTRAELANKYTWLFDQKFTEEIKPSTVREAMIASSVFIDFVKAKKKKKTWLRETRPSRTNRPESPGTEPDKRNPLRPYLLGKRTVLGRLPTFWSVLVDQALSKIGPLTEVRFHVLFSKREMRTSREPRLQLYLTEPEVVRQMFSHEQAGCQRLCCCFLLLGRSDHWQDAKLEQGKSIWPLRFVCWTDDWERSARSTLV